MKNETQLDRYKMLLEYLDKQFKEEVNIKKVESISLYSYRNINRIFEALHHETIGKYVKRIRLEKAAEFLKYSDSSISDIAFEVGFSDIAAFSKAFKNRFNCAPSVFRNSNEVMRNITRQTFLEKEIEREKLVFEIETLPQFEVLYLEHRGNYENIKAIKETWGMLVDYTLKKQLLTDDTIFFAEILDDNEISETINCRYNVAIIMNESLSSPPEGLFKIKLNQSQKYVKFLHLGSHESSADTYHKIYSQWMIDVNLEFADLPTLEFFLNDEDDTPAEELLTEIYIPVK
ncbi:MAG: AraC family transcriptional regulator [Saprospiraceae bacterium]|jgi:AraC family transcriptional regulator